MFYNNSPNDNLDFVYFGDESLNYNDFFNICDDLYKGYNRDLVLIECYKNISTAISIVGALRSGLVPILVDGDTHSIVIENILRTYKPAYTVNCNCSLTDLVMSINGIEDNKIIDDNLALLVPTSGSTGDSKLVKLSYKNIQEVTFSINRYLNIDHNAVSIMTLPFNYIYGLSCLFSCIASRSKFIITDYSISDFKFWNLFDKFKITDIAGVPFIISFLNKYGIPKIVWKNLKRITQAGGKLDNDVVEAFANTCIKNNVNFFVMYGQTEASPRISYLPPSMILEKIGSVGIPIDIGSVYIDEHDINSELIYKGANVCMGYAYTIDDLALPDVNLGVLKTGDSGYIDADGYIYITGRLKRFIKINGISYSLDNIESSLNASSYNCIVDGEDDILYIYNVVDSPDPTNYIMNSFNVVFSKIKIINIKSIIYYQSGKINYNLTMKNVF